MKRIIIYSSLLILIVSLYVGYKFMILNEYKVDSESNVSYEVLEVKQKLIDNNISYINYKDISFILPTGKYNKEENKNGSVIYKRSDDVNSIRVDYAVNEEVTVTGLFDSSFVDYIFKKHNIETDYDLLLARMNYEEQNVSVFSSVNKIKEKNFFHVYDELQGVSVIYKITGDLDGVIKQIETQNGSMYEIRIGKYYRVYELSITKSDMTINDIVDFLSTVYVNN